MFGHVFLCFWNRFLNIPRELFKGSRISKVASHFLHERDFRQVHLLGILFGGIEPENGMTTPCEYDHRVGAMVVPGPIILACPFAPLTAEIFLGFSQKRSAVDPIPRKSLSSYFAKTSSLSA